MELFDYATDSLNSPLADRMRPSTLKEFVGQGHIVGDNTLLSRAIRADKLGSCIFYGPAGSGKTSLANVVANSSNGAFEKLNAVSSGISDAKAVIERAKQARKMYNKRTYLMLDECHRWNKAQSDCVLAAIEDGTIIFIGCTTENPFIAMTRAIVSRCRVFEFVKLSEHDIVRGLKKAINDTEKGLGSMDIVYEEKAIEHIAWASSGDLRSAYNALELAVMTTNPNINGQIVIDLDIAIQSIQKKAISVDETIFYDMLSAFCKSLRGSDSDASLFWAFRLIESGCDPLIIYRRLIVHSSEDVGLADSNALVVATNSMLAFERLGMPEGRIPLAHAIIYVANANKSNSVILAVDSVLEDVVAHATTTVPFYLRDKNYPSVLDDKTEYKYPHNYCDGAIDQVYMPKELIGKKYYKYNQIKNSKKGINGNAENI